MPDRRALLDPRLRSELEKAGPDRLRRIAIDAAALAVASVVDRPAELDQVVADSRRAQLDESIVNRVEATAVELDRRYLALLDGGEVEGRSGAVEHAFRMARAASAVAFACKSDPVTAAFEACYEAVHALRGDSDALVEIVRGTA